MFFFIGLLFFMTFLNFNFEVYHQSLCSYWSTCLSLTFVPCGLSLMPLFLFLYFVAFTHLCHILGSIKLKVLFYFLMLFLNCTAFNDLRHSIWLFHYIYPFTLKRHMMISKQPTITFLLYPPCSGSMGLSMKVVTFGYTFCYWFSLFHCILFFFFLIFHILQLSHPKVHILSLSIKDNCINNKHTPWDLYLNTSLEVYA